MLVQEDYVILSKGLVRQDQIMGHSDLESTTHKPGITQNTIPNSHCLLGMDSEPVPGLTYNTDLK